MTKTECIERLAEIIAASAFRDDCSAEISANDWQKGDKNRTYFAVIETSTVSKRYIKYDFGYLDNTTGEYHAGKKDLTANFNLCGARF